MPAPRPPRITRQTWEKLRERIETTADCDTGVMYDLPWWWSDKVKDLLDTVEDGLDLIQ
jgi:hypothetical protein